MPVPNEGVSSPSEIRLTESLSANGLSPNGVTNNNTVDSDSSYSDFLCKIDYSIASTKSQVMLAQGNSE